MSATVGRSSRTFENKKVLGEVISAADRAPAPRAVAFEQVLAKNRIRPMTGYNTVKDSQNPISRQGNIGGFSRVKSAKVLAANEASGPTILAASRKITSQKKVVPKTTAAQKELEYRLVYKKNQGGLKSSNMLLKLMNQNISENIAKNPYAKEISNTGGVQIKAISKKSSIC